MWNKLQTPASMFPFLESKQQYLSLITKKRDDEGSGCQKFSKLRDVIYGRPLTEGPVL